MTKRISNAGKEVLRLLELNYSVKEIASIRNTQTSHIYNIIKTLKKDKIKIKSDLYKSKTEIKKTKCVLCGFSEFTVKHHIIFKTNGGNNTKDNLVDLCPNCHYKIHKNIITINGLKEGV